MSIKVIIAEDDLVSRTVLEGLLKQNGYNVVGTYSTGRSALATLSQNPDIQVAILDWLMPEMTGVEVCKQLMAKGLKEEKHIILVSTQTDKKFICEGLNNGADDYLTKPYNDLELISRLKVAERKVSAYHKLKQYTTDLETLARRNNLLGELAGKSIGAATPLKPGTSGTSSPNIPTGLSPSIANIQGVIQFEATVKSTLEGLGVSGLTTQALPTPPVLKEETSFIAWAPLFYYEHNTWVEVVLASTKAHAQAIVGNILDEKSPTDQSIIDLFSEFANVMRGSSKALTDKNQPVTPFIPLTVTCATPQNYLNLAPRKRCIQCKIGAAEINAYLIEHEAAPTIKNHKTITPMELTAKGINAKDANDQILVPQWTILNLRMIERITNFVQSETAIDEITVVAPSPFAIKMAPTI